MHGVMWTKAEIDLLVSTVENNECLSELATNLTRTEKSVRSKACKLRLKPSLTPAFAALAQCS
jgi:hypothetical protein